jgi:hypothetical protein
MKLLLILFYIYIITYFSVYSQPTGIAVSAADTGCRMAKNQLLPVIKPENPYIFEYHYYFNDKAETGRIDVFKKLLITQEVCLRHHIFIRQLYEKNAPEATDRKLIIEEVLGLLEKVFFGYSDNGYWRGALEAKLPLLAQEKGSVNNIAIPLADLTIIINYSIGRLEIEIVQLLYHEKIHRPGIPDYWDDAKLLPKK